MERATIDLENSHYVVHAPIPMGEHEHQRDELGDAQRVCREEQRRALPLLKVLEEAGYAQQPQQSQHLRHAQQGDGGGDAGDRGRGGVDKGVDGDGLRAEAKGHQQEVPREGRHKVKREPRREVPACNEYGSHDELAAVGVDVSGAEVEEDIGGEDDEDAVVVHHPPERGLVKEVERQAEGQLEGDEGNDQHDHAIPREAILRVGIDDPLRALLVVAVVPLTRRRHVRLSWRVPLIRRRCGAKDFGRHKLGEELVARCARLRRRPRSAVVVESGAGRTLLEWHDIVAVPGRRLRLLLHHHWLSLRRWLVSVHLGRRRSSGRVHGRHAAAAARGAHVELMVDRVLDRLADRLLQRRAQHWHQLPCKLPGMLLHGELNRLTDHLLQLTGVVGGARGEGDWSRLHPGHAVRRLAPGGGARESRRSR